MRNHLMGSILVVAAIAFSSGLLAQTPARPGPGETKSKPDLSGVWTGNNTVGLSPDAGSEAAARDLAVGRVPWFAFAVEEPPMQPWAAARYKANRAGVRPSDPGRNETNPILYPYCLPEGMPRSYTISTFEVLQYPERIYMLFERNHQVRRIYTDGRKHFENWSPSFMGISHGRWDGDTLIVETENLLGLDGFAWLDAFGHPFTDALRVTERIRRADQNTLQIDFTFDDPNAYTKPWGGRKSFRLVPDGEVIEQIVCDDHLRKDFIRDMKSGQPAGQP